MPTFTYHGQTVCVETLYSYARVSSSQQTIEVGGEGIPRQLELHENFAKEFGLHTETLSGLQFIDDGKSGSKGDHIKDGGALHAFMQLATTGKLKPKAGLTVESFSRLSRLPIDEALELFLAIIRSGVTLITLVDHRVYSRESLRKDQGQIFMVAAAMQAARAMADATSDYSKNSWKVRRGTPRGLCPSWFDKYANGVPVIGFKGQPRNATLELRVDPIKHAVIQRMFHDVLDIGVDALARKFNQEGVPTFTPDGIWNQASISAHIRGRMVLGEQVVGKMIEGKREPTEQIIKDAYPAVVTEDQWIAANAAMNARKKGSLNGRNIVKMANMFGQLARCGVCGGRMKIKQKGRVSNFKYFGCSNAGVGKCSVKKYHRLDQVETRVLDIFGNLALSDFHPTPVEDKAATIKLRISTATTEADKISAAYQRSMMRSGDLAEMTQIKLEAEHAAKMHEIKLLERELAVALTARPQDEQLAIINRQAGVLDGLEGDELVAARRQIATALPTLIETIAFYPTGNFIIRGGSWAYDCAPEGSALRIFCGVLSGVSAEPNQVV